MGFIEEIGQYVQKYAPQYGIKVCSPIIAQAILESASGTSELAQKAKNYFGIKYRVGRCPSCIGVYHKVGSEQNPDGSYSSSAMEWCLFDSMENSVIGYFDFISISRYDNLKGVTDPRVYLENIKADGYATSANYVTNLMKVIDTYNLTQYDSNTNTQPSNPVVVGGNSPLVSYTKLSPNNSGKRTQKIHRITPHCVVGQLSVERIGDLFAQESRQASSNYGIGSDCRVGMYVEECNRSWCSSSRDNDQQAVTIECASDTKEPYAFKPEVYDKLVELCVDICKRNGKTKLLWFNDKERTLAYVPKDNEMVLTVHRWFKNKACPGDWLYNRLGVLANTVTERLSDAHIEPIKPIVPSEPTIDTPKHYRVQVGYYSVKANAEAMQKKLIKAGFNAIIKEE